MLNPAAIETMILCSLFFASTGLLAQPDNAGTIKGLVIGESTNQPLEFVNVALYRKGDTTIVMGTATDTVGKLELPNIPTGEFVIRFSLIGYKEKTTPAFVIDSRHKHLNLGTISLAETTISMDEVEVTAEKPLITYSAGRMVYNVDQDVMSRSSSASEILQNIPSIKVEIDGKVSLRGSSNVLIMINGKKSALMAKHSADVLEQMPASSIDRIEVITNPSARYKADGKSGIINIVLKKSTALGINGNLTAHEGSNGRRNGSFRCNYNSGILNVYGTLSVRTDYRNRSEIDARLWEIPNGTSITRFSYNDSIFSFSRPNSSTATLGLDYRIDGRNSSGVSGSYFHHGFTGQGSSRKVFLDANGAMQRDYVTQRSGYQFEDEYAGTTYFRHNFSKEDHKLRLEFTASGSPKQEDNSFVTDYRLPQGPPRYDRSIVKERDNRRQLSLDYSDPLSATSGLEAGYAGEFTNQDMSLYSEFFSATRQQFIKDTVKTYDFRFDESIHALYVTYKQMFGAFEFLGGLRAERAFNTSDLVTRDSTISNSYSNIYPSAHLAHKFNDSTILQLSYSRRINRPTAKELNPFPEYRDSRTVFSGNPALLPEYVHSIELGCQYHRKFFSIMPTLFYRHTYNRITSIRQGLNRLILLTTKENLAHDRSLGLELVVSINTGRFFSAHFSANGMYDEIDAPDIEFLQNRIIRSFNGALTTNFNLTKDSRLQIASHFNSSRLTPQGVYLPNNVVNLGVRQEFFGDRLTLVLTVGDVFKSLKRELDLDAPPLHQAVLNTRDTRIIYLGFTFRFGTLGKKSREEQWHYDEDQ